MGVLSDQSIFSAMRQNGPFAVNDNICIDSPFSIDKREWVRVLCADQVQTTKYRAVRSQVFNLLQIDSFAALRQLLDDAEAKQHTSDQACRLLGRLFNIDGDLWEVRTKLREFGATADAVIDYLRGKILSSYTSHVEISNEIGTTADPVELLLMVFDDRYHKKVRFEAKRKLVLMNLAGAIDQREREIGVEARFKGFIRFLDEHVWSQERKIGEHRLAYLLSEHAHEDYRCTRVQAISIKEASDLELKPGQRLTFVKRRLFNVGSKEIPVYVSVRKKEPAAKVIKLLRKNEKNPAVAVDDELGLMAVLDSRADVTRFVDHLSKAAVRSGVLMSLEDISDTLDGGRYAATSTGSSGQTRMLKFFARLGDTRVEFIIHTNQTFLDYHFQHGISHDEYEVRRLFDSGVAEFLFPQDIYQLDMEVTREILMTQFRKEHHT
ncbi:MAG: hypothetical protein ACWA5X_10510 [bacterium]